MNHSVYTIFNALISLYISVEWRSSCEFTVLLKWGFQVRPTEALSIHHCLCPCTKELWVLLMHLLERRHKVLHREVKTNTHLFARAVKYERVYFRLTSVCSL